MSIAPSINRRDFLKTSIALAALTVWPQSQAAQPLQQLESSDLIYLTPVQSSGRLSRCQAEVWFVWNGADIYVCTVSSTWRSRAVRAGLTHTKLWIGDVGIWTESDGKYKTLPSFEAKADVIHDQGVHKHILDLFADKYPLGWIRWGPRFRNGLKDGTRTLIKYQPQF